MKKGLPGLFVLSGFLLIIAIGACQVMATGNTWTADFNDGALAGWTPNGGVWTNPGNCVRVVCGADAWNIAAATASDFTYSGDLMLESGNAAGLSFRTNANGTQGYDVIIDRIDGRVKLCKRPYMVLGSYNFSVKLNQVYHVGIIARGTHFTVSLDGVERINVTDTSYAGGRFGMFGYAATAQFDNLRVVGGDPLGAAAEPVVANNGLIFRSDFSDGALAGWTPNGGAWTNPGNYARVVCGADAWNIAAATVSDFKYSGDLMLEDGNAAGLSFRTNANGTQGYDVIIDRMDGRVKLCKRPYMVLGSYNFSVKLNQVYHVGIIARGTHFTVSLDGAERLNVTDPSYAGGRFGMFGYAATAQFDNLLIESID